ncbi:MAG: ChbG/HpnK family deacetylase, partial [Pseudomonadota bacterium]|nr:ChbG/HpnK family deacetylase [Pseudomonadota bacterium]
MTGPRGRISTRLVITADDFGLHAAVNRAVEQGHRQGVLSAASLMMHAPGSDEAVDIARRTPSLRVGLHVMVADGWASSPAREVPGIATPDGVMDARVIARSFRFLLPSMAGQLRREI